MNDRYLYRAKRIDNGEWVEGFLIFEKDRAFIAHRVCEVMNSYSKTGEEYGFGNFIEVYPSTICQCTGLKDKSGKLIWENDICIITDGTLDEEDGYFRLDWEIDRAMFEFEGTGICANFDNVSGYDCEVVGNIFDNPELLEVEE